jgi:hypothetical protein
MSVSQKTHRWRGLDWPVDIPEHQRHLLLWKFYKEAPYKHAELLNPISEHVLEACKLLFTEDQLVIHPWFETQAYSWTYDDFAIWWGSAGSGKSHSLGLFTLLDYITSPDDTFALLCSTTKEMLAMRSFASVVQYLHYLKANRKLVVPFKAIAQPMCVVPEAGEDIAMVKCKILGVAVQMGTTEQARSNLQGVHCRNVRLILDELSALRPAAIEARNNLAQCPNFKLIGACNPESVYDLAGAYSVPKGGWASVGLDSDSWETSRGKVWRFDGLKSPGLADPVKYSFLPTRASIDRIIQENNGNEDAPAVWTFVRAFPPPQGLDRTVLTEAMVLAYGMQDTTMWKESYVRVAGFDPAFTNGGDLPALVFGKVGLDIRGILTICFDRLEYLKIEASSKRPVLEQLVDQLVDLLQVEGVTIDHLGIDDSGTQSVADALEMKLGLGVYRCNFSRKPPELAVSMSNPAPASERYRDTVSWMYYLMGEYAQRAQIRGLPEEAANQLCRRRVKAKLRPLQIESKDDMKKRIHGRSPDAADACVIVAALARERLGVMPGAAEWAPMGVTPTAAEGISMDWLGAAQSFNNLGTTYGGGSL